MKKIVVNICDCTYEKLAFEAMQERKIIQQIIEERLLTKPFSPLVNECYQKWLDNECKKLLEE